MMGYVRKREMEREIKRVRKEEIKTSIYIIYKYIVYKYIYDI